MSNLNIKFPEHAKQEEVIGKSQPIGEFIENSPYVLAEWVEREDCWDDCPQPEHPHVREVSNRTEEVLAEYFNIDLKKIEQEKRDMLAEIMNGNTP